MQKVLTLVTFFAMQVTLATPASAGTSWTGTISYLGVGFGGGYGEVQLNTAVPTPRPSCETQTQYMVFPIHSLVGQSMFKALLQAKQSNSQVTLRGTGQCMNVFDGISSPFVESVAFMYF